MQAEFVYLPVPNRPRRAALIIPHQGRHRIDAAGFDAIRGAGPGGRRQARLQVYRQPTILGQITELQPNKVLTFKVTQQPNDPEILGHVSLDKGQLYLEANPDGSTTVIETSWHHLYVRPAGYFDLWANGIVRRVHFRMLNHIKALAEADHKRSVQDQTEVDGVEGVERGMDPKPQHALR